MSHAWKGRVETHDAHTDTVDSNNVLDGCIALGLVQTVAAGLVKGAEMDGSVNHDKIM